MKKTIYKAYYYLSKIYFSNNIKPKSRILIFHNYDESNIANFENNIETLKSQGYTFITAFEFAEKYFENSLHHQKYCALTFDDGFISFSTLIYPILQKHNVTATVFINQKLHEFAEKNLNVNSFVQEKFPRVSTNYSNLKGLSKSQIELLIQGNVEIGGHTYSHPNLGEIPKNELHSEINDQIQYFKKNFDYQLKVFAYPYGRKRNFSNDVIEVLKTSDYKYSFTGISKNVESRVEVLTHGFPRTSINENCVGKAFIARLSGASDLYDRILKQY